MRGEEERERKECARARESERETDGKREGRGQK